VAEEREGQLRRLADPLDAPLVGLVDHLGRGRDGEVGQLPGLEAGPKPSTGVSSGAEAGRRSTTSAAAMDAFYQLNGWVSVAGWPRGAQLRRTLGSG
jgi:hypothetical protein